MRKRIEITLTPAQAIFVFAVCVLAAAALIGGCGILKHDGSTTDFWERLERRGL